MQCLLEGGPYSMWILKDASLIRVRPLFEGRRLLEELRYIIWTKEYRYSPLCELNRLVYGGWHWYKNFFPAGNYMFKVNNRNIRTRCDICSKLTIKIPEWCHWCCSDIFIVKFEHISHLVLVFLLLTLSR